MNLPLPAQLSLTGNLATNWKRFQRALKNYEIAARLKGPSNSCELQRFSPVLAWMHWMFTTPLFLKLQSRDIDIVLEKFALARKMKRMNCYRFNKCDQKEHETIDAYVTSLCTLAKTCNFGQLENDLIRDRVVMGIRDNTTREKLLQYCKT